MLQSQLAATRRHVAMFVGATLAISGLVIWGARQLSPERAVDTPAATSTETLPSEPPATLSASRVIESAPPAPRPAAPPRDDEGSLMSELRAIKQRDPKRALELAREGNRRFPNSEAAAERASIAIHALTALGQASEARGEAEDMVNRYPDNEWVREIERFTGAHRHRNVRVNAEGKLEYYDSAPNAD